MTDNTELKRLAAYHFDLHGDTWYSEESLQLESIPTFSAEAFIVVASPAAVLALIAENESVHKHWQNESNNVQVLVAEFARLKAENEIFEEGMRSIACSLSAGGYNAETLTATQLVEKVQWGVDHFADTSGRMVDQLRAEVAGLKTGYEAYERVNAELKAENEALRKNADRYQWLRLADWWRSPICVIRNPKEQAKLGSDCPTGERLDIAVDAAMSKGEQS